MDLKDFIKETISSIAEAVVDLQADLGDKGVVINPPRVIDKATAEVFDPEDRVSFDVALTASKESAGKGGGGLQVAVLGVGLNAGGEVANRATAERVSRVAFSISIALPLSKHANERLKRLAAEKAEEDEEEALAEAGSHSGRCKVTRY